MFDTQVTDSLLARVIETRTVVMTFESKAAPRMAAPIAWEYQVERNLMYVSQEMLNERGNDGWELMGFFDGTDAVFKRPRDY